MALKLPIKYKEKRTEPRAIEILKSKGYEGKYLGLGKDIHLVGIDFDPSKRTISHFAFENIKRFTA